MSTDERFAAAIDFAVAHEIPWPRDPAADASGWGLHQVDPPPYNCLRGPVHARGGVSGVVRQRGRVVAAWGEPDRADLTFSVAKSYLAMLAGVAHGRGLLPDVDEPVVERVRGIGFESTHNRQVTWQHLLTQTSEWEGSNFGIPDTVDRYRHVTHEPRAPQGKKGDPRPLQRPGTYWEYNDVRINQFSLALLHLFQQPLPEVFDEALMQPLECSASWRWRGYDDATVDLAGRRVQSVPGGTHWGGGVSISASDQSRLGQLLLDGGSHGGRELLPSSWVHRMRQPCAIAPYYGWLLWLNGDGSVLPGASTQAYCMVGAGGHLVWMEPAHEAVVVVRWMDPAHTAGFMERMTAALAQD
ncbi:MAG TPA: serine hydrolase domain-containing protein [Burkholderiaceae bacterium]|nr:serine hydrolase domain-containing protein [Burkholderiaceae bacterium]